MFRMILLNASRYRIWYRVSRMNAVASMSSLVRMVLVSCACDGVRTRIQ